jgi:hypothetical protein
LIRLDEFGRLNDAYFGSSGTSLPPGRPIRPTLPALFLFQRAVRLTLNLPLHRSSAPTMLARFSQAAVKSSTV